MFATQSLAVEIVAGEDHLNIWVDANNNGVRDDDDVMIFVTSSGGVYAESASFKTRLDDVLKSRISELALEYMRSPSGDVESKLGILAHEWVVKALSPIQQ